MVIPIFFVFLSVVVNLFAAGEEVHEEPRTIALVLGPARSGTSTITRAVHACGYAFSAQVEEVQAKIATGERVPRLNPHGSFEDPRLVRLMRAHDFHHDLPLDHPLLEKDAALTREFLGQALEGHSRLVFKHPILSKNALLFEEVMPEVRFLYVIALRHPVDVARSMHAAFSVDRPDLLEAHLDYWCRNLTDALETTEGKPRIFVKYDDVMERTEETLTRLSAFLGTDLTPEALALFQEAFLTEDLRHGRTPFSGEGPTLPLSAEHRELRDRLEYLYQEQWGVDL